MRRSKRTFVLTVSREELEDFLEYLEKQMEGMDYSYRFSVPGRLAITVYGTREEMIEGERAARRAFRDFHLIRGSRGVHRYPREWLIQTAGGVSLSLITTAMRASGRRADWEGDVLVSDMDLEELSEMLGELRSLLVAARMEIKQRKVREVVVAASYVSGRTVLETLEEAIERGLIRVEGEMYMFSAAPERVLEELSKPDEEEKEVVESV